MKPYFKVLVVLLVSFLYFEVGQLIAWLLTQPSDLSFFLGLSLAVYGIVLGYATLKWIFRGTNEESSGDSGTA